MATVATPTALVYNNANLAVGDNVITNGVANKKIYVTQYRVSSNVPVTLQSSDKTVQIVALDAADSAGGTSTAVLPTGAGLIATVTQAGTASGYIMGFIA